MWASTWPGVRIVASVLKSAKWSVAPRTALPPRYASVASACLSISRAVPLVVSSCVMRLPPPSTRPSIGTRLPRASCSSSAAIVASTAACTAGVGSASTSSTVSRSCVSWPCRRRSRPTASPSGGFSPLASAAWARAMASTSRIETACWASMSAAGVFTRGSIPTASGCARTCPSAVSRTVYVPGTTQGPRGSRGVSKAIAAIG